METLTISKALTEIKTLDKRIDQKTSEIKPLGFTQKLLTTVNGTILSPDEFKKEVVGEFKSISDLITRRNRIKKALLRSNIETMIIVGGETMSIAEAIVYEKEIVKEKNLLRRFKSELVTAERALEQSNKNIVEQINTNFRNLSANENIDLDRVAKNQTKQIDENKLNLIDPLGIKKEIEKLSNKIEAFEKDVDYAKSDSNAVTTITID